MLSKITNYQTIKTFGKNLPTKDLIGENTDCIQRYEYFLRRKKRLGKWIKIQGDKGGDFNKL